MNILKLKSVSNVATERVLHSWFNGKFLCLALFDKEKKENARIWLDVKEQEELLEFLLERYRPNHTKKAYEKMLKDFNDSLPNGGF